jgi:aspartyl-tRNA(Asn)/glutamyl-tRNA(Gln) amidotransferase subunit A
VGDLAELTLIEAADAIRDGVVSPVELTEHYLARIAETEPVVHAYTTVAVERARAEAQAAEAAVRAGEALGTLHGIPVGVKDLIDTAGLRTTYGSPAWEHHVPGRDATAVARLRGAGAIILGKHATHELAWGGRTDSAYYGPTHNPHRRDHIPGGSSGGSAASVAAGSSLGAIGTDTAGSVRIPAALSGCVGFKPSRGRVSLAGVKPLAPSLDHVGSLARTVADAAVIVAAIAGVDSRDPGTFELTAGDFPFDPAASPAEGRSYSIAFLSGWPTALLDSGVRAALDRVRDHLSVAGATVGEVEIPGEAPAEAVLERILAEAGAAHRPAYEQRPDLFGHDLAELLELPAPDPRMLAVAQATTARATASLLEVLAAHDVLVLPTVAVTAPRIGAMHLDLADHVGIPVELVLTRLTSIFNAAGLPAVSVPVGLVEGLPVGLQVVGRPGGDAAALTVAAVIEQLSATRGDLT